MKIALAYSPFLLSRTGGLQEQLLSIHRELVELGVDAKLFSIDSGNFSDFDLIHIFDAESCNFRLVEEAKKHDIKIVVSSIIGPNESKYLATRDDLIEKAVKFFSKNSLSLTKEQTRWCLNGADAVIALGEVEKNTLSIHYGIKKNSISIIPNGVSSQFFSPEPSLFIDQYHIEKGYILCVGSIYPLKNQLLLADITKNMGVSLVLIGDIRDKHYFDQIQAYTHVNYIGTIKDKKLLASAYAAASVFTLISEHEIMPLVVLEALASCTPIMMTNNHSMSLNLNLEHVKQVDPSKIAELKKTLTYLIEKYPNRQNINQESTALSWREVAQQHLSLYKQLFQH